MFCKNCGAKLEPEDKFCVMCGAPREEKKPKKKIGLILLIIAGVILLLGIGIFAGIMWMQKKESPQTEISNISKANEDETEDDVLQEEELLEEIEEEETIDLSNETDPFVIAEYITAFPYIGEDFFELQYQKDADSIYIGPLISEQIISADYVDMDQDGEDEILVIALTTQEDLPFWLAMLEKTDTGWIISSDLFLNDSYRSPYLYDPIVEYGLTNVIVREDEYGTQRLFVEEYGEGYYLDDCLVWELYTLSYHDETFFTDMDPMSLIWTDEDTIYLDGIELETEEGILYFFEMAEKLYSLGFEENILETGGPVTIMEDEKTTELLLIEKVADISTEDYETLSREEVVTGLGSIQISITDRF